MNRRIIQDVVFPSRRREDTVGVSGTDGIEQRDNLTQEPSPARQPEDFLPKIVKQPPQSGLGDRKGFGRGEKSPRVALWVITILVLVVALGIILAKFFSGATIKITPLHETVVLDAEFLAHPAASGSNELLYQRVVLPEEERGEEAGETIAKDVLQKASGSIRIYNEYSSASQRLIKNTRFESPDGKIYRIDGSVVVPGATIAGGKVTPGSVEVMVYADAPGESYNSPPTDFTIPGFKGDPRYEKFYARSETPLAGGFSGKVNVPTPEAALTTKEKLKTTLADELYQKALAQVPAGFILYPDAAFVVFNELNDGSQSPTSSRVTVKGSFYGLIFDKNALSRAIAKEALQERYNEGSVLVRNLEELKLSPTAPVTDPEGLGEFAFTLAGTPRIVWDVNFEKLKEDLRGTDKRTDFQRIVGGEQAIKKAEAKILPFWTKVFPDDVRDIRVIEVLE